MKKLLLIICICFLCIASASFADVFAVAYVPDEEIQKTGGETIPEGFEVVENIKNLEQKTASKFDVSSAVIVDDETEVVGVVLKKTEIDLLNLNGMSLEDAKGYTDYCRTLGMSDKEIQAEFNTVINGLENADNSAFGISKSDLFFCEISGISKENLNSKIKELMKENNSLAEVISCLRNYLNSIKYQVIKIAVFSVAIIIVSIIVLLIILRKLIKEKKEIMSKIPKENYHILGYITFLYLGFITAINVIDTVEYGYYQILRWLVSAFSLWTTVRIFKENSKSHWLLIFSAIVILFNPVFILKFEQEVWQIFDFVTLAIFAIYAFIKRK